MLFILSAIILAMLFPVWAVVRIYGDSEATPSTRFKAAVMFIVCMMAISWWIFVGLSTLPYGYTFDWLFIYDKPIPPFPI